MSFFALKCKRPKGCFSGIQKLLHDLSVSVQPLIYLVFIRHTKQTLKHNRLII